MKRVVNSQSTRRGLKKRNTPVNGEVEGHVSFYSRENRNYLSELTLTRFLINFIKLDKISC